MATCPSIPAAHFAFRLCFSRFVFVVYSCLSSEPKQIQGRGLVDHKLVEAPPPNNFFAGPLLFCPVWEIAVHLAVAGGVYDGVFSCRPFPHEISWMKSLT